MASKDKKYELSAPAGDFPMLVAAVNAGADAVYFGLKEFNMRANAKNFSLSDLKEIKKICKSSGKNVKMYLTLNSIIYGNELGKVERILKKVKEYVDAVICWDFAVIELCRKHKIPFFISTQASVSNPAAAEFYKKLGARRIVLARELNLKQIKEIVKSVGIEVECFAHGAMCVSISGRCFMSQFAFRKSANRGECLQNCRRTYTIIDEEGNELKLENSRVLSAKDLCTLPFLEKLKKAGITSFKIEGRNRDARYVDTVVRVYRKALDRKLTRKEVEDSMKELEKVYNRGFSRGFYFGVPTADDFSNVENSAASERKHFIGKVTHYYPKVGVATIRLVSKLKTGDEIIIIGKTTGIEKCRVERIEINKNPVEAAIKGQEVGIKMPNRVRKNDEVYVIKKN